MAEMHSREQGKDEAKDPKSDHKVLKFSRCSSLKMF